MHLDALVLGVLNGLTIGLLAVGLVLVYKAHRFINLAHAQMGTISAIVLAKLAIAAGLNWWLAFPVAVALGVGVGLGVERFVIRPLRAKARGTVPLLLVTIGVSQLLIALTFVKALQPNSTKLALRGYPMPFHSSWTVGSLVLTSQYLLILIIVPTLVVALAAFLRYTALGKMIRAAASNADAARLCGVPVQRIGALSWGIAGGLAAVTAILQAPAQGTLNAEALGPDLLLSALGAAVAGGFVSVPWALAGGVLLGVVGQLTLSITSNGGTAHLAVVATIMVILFVRGRAIVGAVRENGSTAEERAPTVPPASVRTHPLVVHQRVWLGLAGIAIAAVLPLLPYFRPEGHRFELVLVLLYAVVGISITMVVGWAGQVSLGHFALVGVGAYLTARLAPHEWSVIALLALAGVLGAVIMTIVGFPALRLRGLTLAVTTLGFAVVAPAWLFVQSWFGVHDSTGLDVRPPHLLAGAALLGSQLSIYYVALALLVVAALAASGLRRSVPGRLVVAVRDNEAAAASFGVTPAVVKLGLLAVSGFMAASAGVLWATTWQHVGTVQFAPSLSLSILAVPVIGGLGSVAGAVAAAFALYMPAFFLAPVLGGLFGTFGRQVAFQLAIGGMGLVGTQMAYPTGIAGAAQQAWEWLLERMDKARRPEEPVEAVPPLVVRDVLLRFGGIGALNEAAIEVDPGEIVGLIGPNGAGKTTLLNVISGKLAADSGSVRVFGQEMVGLPAEMRAHFGLARSFQDAHLFPGLTVRETVQVALSKSTRIGFGASLVRAPWVRDVERSSRDRADEILERLGLTAYADALTSSLSTGTRRICDFAAQVAADPRLLLLDEPTAGVAQREAEVFAPLLRRIRDELECSILIVEHDMPLLMGLCDRVYAMEAGRVIATGTPEEVRNDPAVIASYLGTDETAIRRSGGRRRQLVARS